MPSINSYECLLTAKKIFLFFIQSQKPPPSLPGTFIAPFNRFRYHPLSPSFSRIFPPFNRHYPLRTTFAPLHHLSIPYLPLSPPPFNRHCPFAPPFTAPIPLSGPGLKPPPPPYFIKQSLPPFLSLLPAIPLPP